MMPGLYRASGTLSSTRAVLQVPHLQRWKHLWRHQCLLVVEATPYRQSDEDRQKREETHYLAPILN